MQVAEWVDVHTLGGAQVLPGTTIELLPGLGCNTRCELFRSPAPEQDSGLTGRQLARRTGDVSSFGCGHTDEVHRYTELARRSASDIGTGHAVLTAVISIAADG